MKNPNLFIVGAPKCGTTAMIHYLSQHPNVFISETKEPHFYNTDSNHRYYCKKDEYLSLFNLASSKHSYRGEGSVWYLYSKVAISNILKDNPEAKFLILLRDPKKMFFSLHQELLFGGSENQTSSIEAWNLQETRKSGKKIPPGCTAPELLQYGNACKLGEQSLKATRLIPVENLKFVLLDEIIDNPGAVYNDVLKFLKIDDFKLDTFEVVNKKKVRKWPFISKLFIYVSKIKRSVGLKKGFGLASAINKRNVKSGVSINSDEIEKLMPELHDYFIDDINLLESTINKDLSKWK